MDRLVAPLPPLLPALLPPLREDLCLHPAAPDREGAPAWTIQDPVANRFYRIGWTEFEMLAHWRLRDPTLVLGAIREAGPLAPEPAALAALLDFLRRHHLLRASTAGDIRALEQSRVQASGRWATRLLHDYLFFRVPLLRPQRWLQVMLPWVAFAGSRGFTALTVACTLLGLLLALRQWDVFLHTFQGHAGPSGLIGFAIALAVAKSLHELAHAFVATRYGVRVAHMGVAFLVMWPMLYTDTGESWKLADRRERFVIAAAGIRAELALAGFATLAWSLVADGPLRAALFFLATTSWVVTLAINASPFMRFDGYFLLSDALDIPNLHQRAFALARAALRRGLLGWDEPDPEPFAPRLRRALVAFAWLTWIWRLVVFVGIALAVYHFFFKALGLFLLAVELGWFVARPILSELSTWVAAARQRLPDGVPRGALASGLHRPVLLLALVIALLAVPWQRDIRAEAWAHARQQQLLYAPVPARVVRIAQPGPVGRGTVLALLDSPDVRSRAVQSQVVADALALELDRMGGRAGGLERRAVVAQRLERERAELLAQREELARLVLAAPFDGVLADVDPELAPGVWVNPSRAIAVLYDPSEWVVDALVPQEAIGRFAVGAPARFHVRGRPVPALAATVVAIDSARAQSLPHAMLAARHGGRVPTIESPDHALLPRDALYRVRLRLDAPSAGAAATGHRHLLGSVAIEGQARAPLVTWVRWLAALGVRESGF
jgi:putative peptide zinc metalloprotease protein